VFKKELVTLSANGWREYELRDAMAGLDITNGEPELIKVP